ncbi:MAG: hypothetical protein ABSF90_10515 [Syntrophobacteraceae bacterium]|jgi:hypothetical protein
MGLANFLADEYGAKMVMDALEANYPPGVVLVDALGDSTFPGAMDAWADAHAKWVLTQPPGPDLPWGKYRHRFLCDKPGISVLLDLLKDLGLTELAGIDVNGFIRAMLEYKVRASK